MGRLARIKPKLRLLGRMKRIVADPGAAHAPAAREHVDDLCGRSAIRIRWSKVPSPGKSCAVDMEVLGQSEIATETIEHVLPRAHCLGMAEDDLLASLKRCNGVRNELAGGPVTSSDYVPGARTGDRNPRALGPVDPKEGLAVRLRNKLRTRLAVRVRVP